MSLLHVTNKYNDELKALLENSVIGTPGQGMLYQHKTVHSRISNIQSPYFVELRTRNRLIGTCCFCHRETFNSRKTYQSFYIRYFTFMDKFRTSGIPSVKTRVGKLREEIKNLMAGNSSTLPAPDKFFHYAYVDPRNTRSVRLCEEFGFREVRNFKTFVFSRISPEAKSTATITSVSSNEIPEIKKFLLEKYADYNMVSLENLFVQGRYYVIRDAGGNILAGAQVTPSQWRIFRMHNKANTVLLHFLSAIPLMNRIVNRNFRFLAVDGLYFTEGNERYSEMLLESLLKKYNHYNAFIPADCESSLSKHLGKLRPGIVHKLSKQVTTSVICRFQNFPLDEINEFAKRPAYVSAVDIT